MYIMCMYCMYIIYIYIHIYTYIFRRNNHTYSHELNEPSSCLEGSDDTVNRVLENSVEPIFRADVE